MPGRLTPQSTVNDFQWRLDVSITLRQSESDADIRTNGQWESAKCSRCAFNPVNTSGVYWGFHPAITVNDGTYETLFIRRVCSLHRSCKYSVARLDGSASLGFAAGMPVTPVCKLDQQASLFAFSPRVNHIPPPFPFTLPIVKHAGENSGKLAKSPSTATFHIENVTLKFRWLTFFTSIRS